MENEGNERKEKVQRPMLNRKGKEDKWTCERKKEHKEDIGEEEREKWVREKGKERKKGGFKGHC